MPNVMDANGFTFTDVESEICGKMIEELNRGNYVNCRILAQVYSVWVSVGGSPLGCEGCVMGEMEH